MSHSREKFEIIAPRSKFYQGPFGRIFSDLPAWSPPGKHSKEEIEQHFLDIARLEMIELPGKTPTEIANDPSTIDALEDQFGSRIPAGYTYFGQFVDHDITFDPASSLMRQNDPAGLINHRTPRLDLDNIYGRGPHTNPYLYDRNDPAKFLIGQIEGHDLPDLPRNSQGRALIGDMRNDENSMVSQLQLAFLLAHNRLVDRARAIDPAGDAFETARTTLRWLYQHIVWHDYIERITINDVMNAALSKETTADGRTVWDRGLKDVYNWRNQPFMPVEFSVAVYRFGHSMVRNSYQTNHPHRGFGNFAPIFDRTAGSDPDDLRGFRPMQADNMLQWDWFLDMDSSAGPFPQMARKIDTKLCNALSFLHESDDDSRLNILAWRNMLRGVHFGLPSGSDIARKFCMTPLSSIEDASDSLWFYILKEAESLPGSNGGNMLGRIGSIIVCATFAGLLAGDPNSYFNIEPCWTPDDSPLLEADDNRDPGDWTLASIIRLSGLPVSAADFATTGPV